ncbi:MAG: hypothetical protein H7Y30_07650, partial [Pyrinomonadaceae bacterium]|nr:hypothetical protein [Pyrinomonadaceae bacterium]
KAYAQKGEFDKAFAALENLTAEDTTRVLILAAAGRSDEARKIVEAFVESDGVSQNPFWVSCLYAATGDHEKAFAWLEKSYKMRQADLVSMKIDPALDSLRKDARYSDLLRRVGLSE